MFPDGCEVVVNTGGPDLLATVADASYPNAAIAALKPVRVRFGASAQWVPAAAVRRATLHDHARVFGLRFADWQRQLYYTLIFHYLQGFEGLDRADLEARWREGWSVQATARQLADTLAWPLICPRGHLGVPAHLTSYVHDLGFDAIPAALASDQG